MPYASAAQARAAHATGGFGGAINLKEWDKKTNFASLPEKVSKKKKKSYLLPEKK